MGQPLMQYFTLGVCRPSGCRVCACFALEDSDFKAHHIVEDAAN